MDLLVTALVLVVAVGLSLSIARAIRNSVYRQVTGREHPLKTARRFNQELARERRNRGRTLVQWEEAKRRKFEAERQRYIAQALQGQGPEQPEQPEQLAGG